MSNSFIASQLNQLGLTIKMVDQSPNLHEMVDQLLNLHKILCIWGHSGVGKSSFINQLVNRDMTMWYGPIFQSCCRGDPATKNPTLFTNIKLNEKCNKRIAVFDNEMNFLASYEPTSINDLEMINEYTAQFLVVYLPCHIYGKGESFAIFECKDINHSRLLHGLQLANVKITQDLIVPIFIFSTPRLCYIQAARKEYKDCGFEGGYFMFMEKYKFTDKERNGAMEWMKDGGVDFYTSWDRIPNIKRIHINHQ